MTERAACGHRPPREVRELSGDLLWGESPRWWRDRLWVSDTQDRQLVALDGVDVAKQALSSPINGTWPRPDGTLAVARSADRRVEVTHDGCAFSVLADVSGLDKGPLGDMTGTAAGLLFVDDMGPDPWGGAPTGRLLCIDTDGAVRVAADGLTFPNGLAVIDGGQTLVVAETLPARLTAFDITPSGELTDRRAWFDLRTLGPTHRPDGLWAATDGGVWAAAAEGGEFVHVTDGHAVDAVPVPGQFAIACCTVDRTLFFSTCRPSEPHLSLLDEALPQRKLRGRVASVELAG